MRVAAVLALVLVACGPAEWRPAKGSENLPATKAAYRVQAAPDCPSIGVVHVEGSSVPLDDISETAAKHGGTHYVVRDEQDDVSYVTRGSATDLGNGVTVGHARTTRVVDRKLWAEVYRCD